MLEALCIGFLAALMFVALPGAAFTLIVGLVMRFVHRDRRWPWRVMWIVWGSIMLLGTVGAAIGLSGVSVH